MNSTAKNNGIQKKMSSATKTRIKEVAVLNQVVDVADFLNLLSLRLSPWFKIRILNVTPWSVSFSIAGFDVFASNETGWKVQVIHDQPGTNGSSARHFTKHLNGVLSGGVRDDAGVLQLPNATPVVPEIEKLRRGRYVRVKNPDSKFYGCYGVVDSVSDQDNQKIAGVLINDHGGLVKLFVRGSDLEPIPASDTFDYIDPKDGVQKCLFKGQRVVVKEDGPDCGVIAHISEIGDGYVVVACPDGVHTWTYTRSNLESNLGRLEHYDFPATTRKDSLQADSNHASDNIKWIVEKKMRVGVDQAKKGQESFTVEAAILPDSIKVCEEVEPVSSKTLRIVRAYHEAIRSDEDLAWTVFFNLAVMARDAGAPHKESNERAADLMKHWFGVDVRKLERWGFFGTPDKPEPTSKQSLQVQPDHIADANKMAEPETNHCKGNVCDMFEPTGIACPHDSCDIETGVRNSVIKDSLTTESNSPKKLDSSRSKDYIPSGWVKLSRDEPRLASDAYWSQGASEWCLIGEDRVNFANRSKWPAIRFGNPSKSSNSSIPPVGSLSGFKVGDFVREIDDSSYAYCGIGVVEDIGNIEDFPIGVRYSKRFYAAYKPEQLEKLPQFSKYQRVKVVYKRCVHSGRIGVVDGTSSDGMVHIHFSPSETNSYKPCDIVAVD